MQQYPISSNLKKNNDEKEPANFIHYNDVRQPVVPGKTYLAHERSNTQMAGIKTNDSMVMFDIFGASDY